MKKLFAALIALMMLVSLTGCGVRQKIGEKVAEGVTEKLLEKADGVGDVDISEDKVTIKGDDGESVTIGGTEWPTSDLVKNIPEFKKGQVASVMESEGYVLIALESVNEDDFKDYIETVKKDFKDEPFEMSSGDGIAYSAKNADGINVMLSYGDESATITIAKAE